MRDTQSDNGSATPSRRVTARTEALVYTAIVASGVIVGGFLHARESEPTATQVVVAEGSGSWAPAPNPTTTAPVTYPTRIPGCTTVDPPAEDGSSGWFALERSGYDNPAYPWFSGLKAVAMTEALRDALPDGVVLDSGSVGDSLVFQPIADDPAEHREPFGFTAAAATLRRGDRAWQLSVSVRQSDAPVPPCVAGALDERRLLDDGVTVDTLDTWSETEGVRTLPTRVAEAYAPDGSVVTASAYDSSAYDSSAGSVAAATAPMSVDELVALVRTPGLGVTVPVPAGTPDMSETCGVPVRNSVAVAETEVDRMDAALAAVSLDGLSFDRPLDALRSGAGGVCQAVRVTRAGQRSLLRVVIAAGGLPGKPAEPSRAEVVGSRQLPDGSTVEDRESPPGSSRVGRGVTVTHPSGTSVRTDSTGEDPSALLSFAQLEAIGLTPGLDVSK